MNIFALSEGRKMAQTLCADLGKGLQVGMTRRLESLQDDLETASPKGDPSTWRSKHKPPAGYQGGNFERSWQPYAGIAPSDPAGVDGTTTSVSGAMLGWEPGMRCGLVNNSPQGRKLEFHGHSLQVGRDFSRKAIRLWLESEKSA